MRIILKLDGGDGSLSSMDFCRSALAGKTGTEEGIDIAPACRACEYPVAEGADIVIGLLGVDVDDHILLQSQTEKGSHLLSRLELPAAPAEENRAEVIAALWPGAAPIATRCSVRPVKPCMTWKG